MRQISGTTLALIAAAVSGISIFINGYAVREFPDPTTFAALKNTLVGVALLGFVLRPGGWATRAVLPQLRAPRRLGLISLSVIGGSVPFVLFFQGLSQASSGNAAFIHKTMFLWVAVLAAVTLRERLGPWHLLALGALGGATLLAGGPVVLESSAVLILGATLLWSLEVVLARHLLGQVPWSLAATTRMAGGAVLLLGYTASQGQLAQVFDLSLSQWGWAVVTAVLLLGYVSAWYGALQRASAVTVTAVLTLGAPITALLGVVAGRPLPAAEQLVSHVAVLGAVGLLIWLARRQTPDPARPGLAGATA